MNKYTISLIQLACISVINITGVFTMTSLCGMFSIGQAAYMCIGAYLTFVIAKLTGASIILTGILGILICAAIAAVVGIPTLKLRRDYFALMTIAFSQIVNSIVIILEKWTNGAIGFSKIPKVDNLVVIILIVTVIVVFMVRNFKYSRFGRMCLAIKNDPIAAQSFGIDIFKLKLKVYILASMIAGLAGIFYGLRNRIITPDAFGWAYSSELQILLFFGGTNSLTGSVLSATILKVLPEYLKGIKIFGVELQQFKQVIYCILIILVINFRTAGLMGEKELSFEWLKKTAKKHFKKDTKSISDLNKEAE